MQLNPFDGEWYGSNKPNSQDTLFGLSLNDDPRVELDIKSFSKSSPKNKIEIRVGTFMLIKWGGYS